MQESDENAKLNEFLWDSRAKTYDRRFSFTRWTQRKLVSMLARALFCLSCNRRVLSSELLQLLFSSAESQSSYYNHDEVKTDYYGKVEVERWRICLSLPFAASKDDYSQSSHAVR